MLSGMWPPMGSNFPKRGPRAKKLGRPAVNFSFACTAYFVFLDVEEPLGVQKGEFSRIYNDIAGMLENCLVLRRGSFRFRFKGCFRKNV